MNTSITQIKSGIARLHFISSGKDVAAHLLAIERACRGGVTCAQLRLKDAVYQEVLDAAYKAKAITEKYNRKLIINDNVAIAKEVGAAGVHLGKEDMPVAEARKILGDNAIIGATANTVADVVYLNSQPIDYIGLGPYRFTYTKKNLSPVLTENTIRDFNSISNKPVLLVGGILLDDINDINAMGAYGVAVSGAIANAENTVQAAQHFVEKIKKFSHE